MSSFLLKTLCWQAISGLPSSGTAAVGGKALRRAVNGLAPVGEAGSYRHELKAYPEDGLVVCTFPRNRVLYAASPTNDRLRNFERDSGVELDWL